MARVPYVTDNFDKVKKISITYDKYDKETKTHIPTESVFYLPADFKERLKKGGRPVRTVQKPLSFEDEGEEFAIVFLEENEEK